MARRPDLAVAAATAVGLALVLLGGASTAANLITLGTAPVLEDMRMQTMVERAAAAAASRASLRAAAFADTCRHLTDAALAASYANVPELDSGRLAARALERCPASPHNWMRLAMGRYLAGQHEAAREAWKMSVLTGPVVPRLTSARLELGLRIISGDDAEYLHLLEAQVKLAADTAPAVLVSATRRTNSASFVRLVLRGEPTHVGLLARLD